MANVIKVLIVDDIPETREMLKKILQFENDIKVVDAAETGRQGLELAGQHRPDIVLMDINMPDMDGITATEEIKKILPNVGIIMMSVQSEADYLRRAMLAGARDFLTKPISGENLYETIRRVYDLTPKIPVGVASSGPGGPAPVATSGGHIIAVYSPQGGAGVTTLATNIAVALMREGTKVALVDGDLQFGDVGVFLNLQSNNTILDLANTKDMDEQLVESVLVSHGSGLKVLLSPRGPDEAEKMAASDLSVVVKELARFYDFVIVDMAKRLDDTTISVMDAAERIILVTTPTLPSVKNVRIMLDLFQQLEYPADKVMFVLNRVNPEAKGRMTIPTEALENHLKRKTDGRIPVDERVFLSAVNQGVSVIASDPQRSPAADLIRLAETIRRSVAGEPIEDPQKAPDKRPSRLSGIFGGR
jgi:pilus assembly protein CpaE